jgi:predicted permease
MGDGDTTAAAVRRAKSYFLVSSIVGNSLTFAIGPRLLDDEESPDKETQKRKDSDPNEAYRPNDEEHADPTNSEGRTAEQEEEHDTENTTLLPNSVARRADELTAEVSERWERHWVKLPLVIRKTLNFLDLFLNGPLIGAIIGATLGLVPSLHRVFFNEPSEGGIFKAWLTASVSNIGELFAALQLVVVGAKLSGSLMKSEYSPSGLLLFQSRELRDMTPKTFPFPLSQTYSFLYLSRRSNANSGVFYSEERGRQWLDTNRSHAFNILHPIYIMASVSLIFHVALKAGFDPNLINTTNRNWSSLSNYPLFPKSHFHSLHLIRLYRSISIGTVYLVASKTNLLDDDPVLWFVLMLMPTGPPATKLTALADVSGVDEDEKMSIAKFVTLCYLISPMICFAVVGALKASLAVTS